LIIRLIIVKGLKVWCRAWRAVGTHSSKASGSASAQRFFQIHFQILRRLFTNQTSQVVLPSDSVTVCSASALSLYSQSVPVV
jgi:hypothetical protein